MKTKVRPAFFSCDLEPGIVRLIAFLFLVAGSTLPLQAQTNAPKLSFPANRYLFIVETSHAMKSRAEGVLRVVEDLLGSGIDGQLHRGDTIALWTYNADLYAGQFPLQQWTPDTQKTVAVRILSFLKQQPYEKAATLQKTLMTMDKVIKNSDFITVILISNGDQLMQGTPFDEQINNLYKIWSKEQQKAHMPFVTVLRAAKGKITHFNITSAPWPVEMPPLPSELLIASTNSASKAGVAGKTNAASPVATKKPAPPMGQPLIISGKKPPVAEAAKPLESVATNQQPLVTNVPLVVSSSEPQVPLAPKENVPVSRPLTVITQIPASAIIPEPGKPQVVAAPPAIGGQRTEDGGRTTGDGSLKSVEPKVADVDPASKVVASTAPTATGPATSQPSTTNGIAATTLEAPTNSLALAPASSPQSAVLPSEPVLARKSIWIAGLIFGVVALGLILLMMRRARSAATSSSSSLITRSFERERKP